MIIIEFTLSYDKTARVAARYNAARDKLVLFGVKYEMPNDHVFSGGKSLLSELYERAYDDVRDNAATYPEFKALLGQAYRCAIDGGSREDWLDGWLEQFEFDLRAHDVTSSVLKPGAEFIIRLDSKWIWKDSINALSVHLKPTPLIGEPSQRGYVSRGLQR